MTLFSFFWIARNNDGVDNDYIVSVYPLQQQAWTGLDGISYVSWETGRGDDVQVCVAFWHLAGGMILAPGDGPVRVQIKLAVREAPVMATVTDALR